MDADRHAPHPMGAAPPELVTLFRDHYRPLMRTALGARANIDGAHDAIQDAFIGFLKRWPMIDDPVPYLHRAVRNNVWKIRRSEEDRRAREMRYLAQRFERLPDEPNIWDDREVVEKILSKLTPSQREIVRLLLAGFTPTEIADRLGRSYDAVRSAQTDIRKRLRAAGYEPGPPAGNDDDTSRRSNGPSAREEDL